MEGAIAKLPDILQIARDTNSIVAVDDSHATGVLGKNGPRHGRTLRRARRGRRHHVDARQGARRRGGRIRRRAGGARPTISRSVRGRSSSRTRCRRRSRRARSRRCGISKQHPERVETLRENTKYFREQITEAGFKPLPGETPIVPIIVGETAAAIQMSDMLLDEGVFVTGFGFPVVPQGQARVRCQISAGHTRDDLDEAIRAFKKVGAKLGII